MVWSRSQRAAARRQPGAVQLVVRAHGRRRNDDRRYHWDDGRSLLLGVALGDGRQEALPQDEGVTRVRSGRALFERRRADGEEREHEDVGDGGEREALERRAIGDGGGHHAEMDTARGPGFGP